MLGEGEDGLAVGGVFLGEGGELLFAFGGIFAGGDEVAGGGEAEGAGGIFLFGFSQEVFDEWPIGEGGDGGDEAEDGGFGGWVLL